MQVALNQLVLADLETAINKARSNLATCKLGSDEQHQIQIDLSVLADLYGKMIYYQQETISMTLLSDTEQVTLLNWVTR
jgi:Protein of unknown function (DUF3717)